MKAVTLSTNWLSIASRGFLFTLIWWILTDGATDSWWIGLPAVLLAVILSNLLIPPLSLVWQELFKFVPFFFIRSLLGGVDVAWRAFHPRLPIDPDLIEYPLQLPPGLPSVFMANTVNLLPGTLCAELDHCTLKVHVLDRRKDFLTELEAVEQHIARMFGVRWSKSGGGK